MHVRNHFEKTENESLFLNDRVLPNELSLFSSEMPRTPCINTVQTVIPTFGAKGYEVPRTNASYCKTLSHCKS